MSSQKNKSNDDAVYNRVQVILESAQMQAARSVNTAQIVANWMIGREIVEEQQQGAKRAGYAERIIPDIATQLAKMGVKGYGELTLRLCRQFYLNYHELPGAEICYALRNKSLRTTKKAPIGYTVGNQSAEVLLLVPQMIEASRREEWKIFTSRHQFHVPTESDLAAEIHRELAELEPLVLKKAKAKSKIQR